MDGTSDLLARHKLTVDNDYRMAEAGILAEDARVALIEGDIIDTAPIGSEHSGTVNWLTNALTQAAGSRAIVTVQNPLRLDQLSEPQPDFMILQARDDFYRSHHPTAADVLLLVEVAGSSLRFDRIVKSPFYCRFGIVEVWVVDLQHQCIEVHREPSSDGYRTVNTHRAGESITSTALPEVTVSVDALLG